MYGIRKTGKYNVDYEGVFYDGKIPYQMVIIEEFNGNAPIEGSRKTLYFRDNKKTEKKYIIPEIRTEAEVEQFLNYPNNAKIKIQKEYKIEME